MEAAKLTTSTRKLPTILITEIALCIHLHFVWRSGRRQFRIFYGQKQPNAQNRQARNNQSTISWLHLLATRFQICQFNVTALTTDINMYIIALCS